MKETSFNFHIPISHFEKGEDGEYRIGGIASTENKDFQGEIVKIDGLDISTLSTSGFFNQDHKKGFENILGRVDKAEKREDSKIGKHLYVEGRLFGSQPAAMAAWNIMSELQNDPAKKMQFSIEGKILKRAGKDGKVIARAKVEHVALTLNPINDNTFASLIKSMEALESNEDTTIESEEEYQTIRLHKSTYEKLVNHISTKKSVKDHLLELVKGLDEKEAKHLITVFGKALGATAAYAEQTPTQFTGGDVLTQESLDKPKKEEDKEKEKRKEDLKSIIKSIKKSYPDRSLEDIMEMVSIQYQKKFGKEIL